MIAGVIGAVMSAAPALAARIVDEWHPGVPEAGLGGDLVVDGYGVSGLGFYGVRLDDGSHALAVCVQADIGHSLTVDYVLEAPATISAELDYLLWRYASSPERPPTDEQAAAINALSWWYTGAQRRGGGPVWRDDTVEISVVGVGRLTGIEAAVSALQGEAAQRRGPWALGELALTDGVASVRLAGPGGPIAGEPVTFTSTSGTAAHATTDDTGLAVAVLADAVGTVQARATGPGSTAALAAPGSQRLVVAGPPMAIEASLVVPPPPTTTTTTLPPTTTTTTDDDDPATDDDDDLDHDNQHHHDTPHAAADHVDEHLDDVPRRVPSTTVPPTTLPADDRAADLVRDPADDPRHRHREPGPGPRRLTALRRRRRVRPRRRPPPSAVVIWARSVATSGKIRAQSPDGKDRAQM